MIQLVPMTADAFDAYRQRGIEEYAAEHVRAGRWSAEEAHAAAAREYEELLPQGTATPNHYLYTIQDDTVPAAVGLLWFALNDEAGRRRVFIYDIEIDPAFRRRGYATAAFSALEAEARALGAHEIRLHVFGHNHDARRLYEKLGFVATNITMSKPLDA